MELKQKETKTPLKIMKWIFSFKQKNNSKLSLSISKQLFYFKNLLSWGLERRLCG